MSSDEAPGQQPTRTWDEWGSGSAAGAWLKPPPAEVEAALAQRWRSDRETERARAASPVVVVRGYYFNGQQTGATPETAEAVPVSREDPAAVRARDDRTNEIIRAAEAVMKASHGAPSSNYASAHGSSSGEGARVWRANTHGEHDAGDEDSNEAPGASTEAWRLRQALALVAHRSGEGGGDAPPFPTLPATSGRAGPQRLAPLPESPREPRPRSSAATHAAARAQARADAAVDIQRVFRGYAARERSHLLVLQTTRRSTTRSAAAKTTTWEQGRAEAYRAAVPGQTRTSPSTQRPAWVSSTRVSQQQRNPDAEPEDAPPASSMEASSATSGHATGSTTVPAPSSPLRPRPGPIDATAPPSPQPSSRLLSPVSPLSPAAHTAASRAAARRRAAAASHTPVRANARRPRSTGHVQPERHAPSHRTHVEGHASRLAPVTMVLAKGAGEADITWLVDKDQTRQPGAAAAAGQALAAGGAPGRARTTRRDESRVVHAVSPVSTEGSGDWTDGPPDGGPRGLRADNGNEVGADELLLGGAATRPPDQPAVASDNDTDDGDESDIDVDEDTGDSSDDEAAYVRVGSLTNPHDPPPPVSGRDDVSAVPASTRRRERPRSAGPTSRRSGPEAVYGATHPSRAGARTRPASATRGARRGVGATNTATREVAASSGRTRTARRARRRPKSAGPVSHHHGGIQQPATWRAVEPGMDADNAPARAPPSGHKQPWFEHPHDRVRLEYSSDEGVSDGASDPERGGEEAQALSSGTHRQQPVRSHSAHRDRRTAAGGDNDNRVEYGRLGGKGPPDSQGDVRVRPASATKHRSRRAKQRRPKSATARRSAAAARIRLSAATDTGTGHRSKRVRPRSATQRPRPRSAPRKNRRAAHAKKGQSRAYHPNPNITYEDHDAGAPPPPPPPPENPPDSVEAANTTTTDAVSRPSLMTEKGGRLVAELGAWPTPLGSAFALDSVEREAADRSTVTGSGAYKLQPYNEYYKLFGAPPGEATADDSTFDGGRVGGSDTHAPPRPRLGGDTGTGGYSRGSFGERNRSSGSRPVVTFNDGVMYDNEDEVLHAGSGRVASAGELSQTHQDPAEGYGTPSDFLAPTWRPGDPYDSPVQASRGAGRTAVTWCGLLPLAPPSHGTVPVYNASGSRRLVQRDYDDPTVPSEAAHLSQFHRALETILSDGSVVKN